MRPIHPGEILREEFLAPLGMTAHALSQAIHVPATRVTGSGPARGDEAGNIARLNESSEAEKSEIWRKYCRRFLRRSLSGAAFRGVTGRTVNPQVVSSSPGRGAKK